MSSLYLVLAGFIAGAINSVAGGGIFAVIPTMVLYGMGAKQIDATASLAVWLGQITSLGSVHKQIPHRSPIAR